MPDIWMDVDTAIAGAPVNKVPLIDDTDFKAIEAAIVYNSAGMALYWHFVTTAGVKTKTAVTPTTSGDYDWSGDGTDPDGVYHIEIPASGGASINNDTEGVGWFTGIVTGVLAWAGPTIGFRAAATNNALIDGALEVGLLDDVITSSKFDESTAFPITSADTGATEVARTGADSDTLETLSDEIAALNDFDPANDDVAVVTLVNTTTDVTNQVSADATAISGSSAAADRLELLALYGDYEGRMIWFDSVNGAAGAVDNVNGTRGNPVSSFANAITLAASLNINHYHALEGSTVTLTQDFGDTTFTGSSWAIVTGGYDLSNAYIHNAFVFGSTSTSDTNNSNFTGCYLLGHTAGSAVLIDCFIGNDFTISEVGNYVFNNCREAIGTAQAAIDFDSAGGAEVQLDNFAGTIELKNMATGDVINIYGNGGVIINANCADGTINRIGGNFFITDNASGNVTITNEVARFGTDQVGDATEAKQDTIITNQGLHMGATFATGTDSNEAIRNRGDAAWVTGGTGGGSETWVYTLLDDDTSVPIPQAKVFVTVTNDSEAAVVAAGFTNNFGKITFLLDAGPYYFWRVKSGYNFTNPDTEVVS